MATPRVGDGLEQPKLRHLDPGYVSRIGPLRGRADAGVGVVSYGSADDITTNRSSLEDTVGLDVGVGSSAESDEAAEKRSKRWLLKATEHDR